MYQASIVWSVSIINPALPNTRIAIDSNQISVRGGS